MSFFKKIFNFKNKPAQETGTKTAEQVSAQATAKPVLPDFVERYTLVNPKTILGNENLWELCDKVPVAYEKEGNHSDMCECVQLHTSIMLPFMNALRQSPDTDIEPAHRRTVSIVNLNDGKKIYVLPILPICKRPEQCWMYFADDKTGKTKNFPRGWSLNMTPQIRRALVEEIKVHTRAQ